MYRQGNDYGIHVYDANRPVATFFDEEEARQFVEAMNSTKAVQLLFDLVGLKDGPRDDAYRMMKDKIWQDARDFLTERGKKWDRSSESVESNEQC